MKDSLSLIAAGANDPEKLIPLVMQQSPEFLRYFSYFSNVVEAIHPELTILENEEVVTVYLTVNKLHIAAIGAHLRSEGADEFKKLLVERLEELPRANAALDRIEQMLKELPPN